MGFERVLGGLAWWSGVGSFGGSRGTKLDHIARILEDGGRQVIWGKHETRVSANVDSMDP